MYSRFHIHELYREKKKIGETIFAFEILKCANCICVWESNMFTDHLLLLHARTKKKVYSIRKIHYNFCFLLCTVIITLCSKFFFIYDIILSYIALENVSR